MNPYNFSLLFFAFSGFFVGLMVWFKRQDDVGRYFFLFSVFAGLWAATLAINLSDDILYETALLTARVGNISAIFIPIVFLSFCAAYTSNFNVYKKPIKIFWLMAISLSLFGFTEYFVPRVHPAVGFAYFATDPGFIYMIYAGFFAVLVILGFYILIQYILRVNGYLKLRAMGVLIALLFGFVGGGLTFVPVFGFMLPQYNIFLLPFYPFILTYFIFRKDLFNEFEIAQVAHKDKLATIGTLAASVNHEIKNPLFVIKGLAESFLQNQKDSLFKDQDAALREANTILEKAALQTERALEIMRNFSGFAKQGISEKPFIKNLRLSDTIEKILPLVSYELKLDRINIINHIGESNFQVQVDERYLEEILFNLIINSCQAMKQTGGELELSAKEEGGKVIVEIKDNGPGISKERQKQIFEPFYTTKEEGTGLGLYITKQLVEKIGGTISLLSEENKGTNFQLELNKA